MRTIHSIKSEISGLLKEGCPLDAYLTFRDLWQSGDFSLEDLLTLEDSLSPLITDATNEGLNYFTPQVLLEEAREAREPTEALRSLLEEVQISTSDSVEIIPSMGGLIAGKMEPFQESPSSEISMESAARAVMSKFGVGVVFSEETIEKGTPSLLSFYAKQAGLAIRRAVEKEIVDLIVSHGLVSFDNFTTTDRSTTGRDYSGAYNGTVTVDDLFKAYSDVLNRGYLVDTILMHPVMWIMFSEQSIARIFDLFNANVIVPGSAETPQGTAPGRTVRAPGALGSTIRIVLSPYVPVTTVSGKVVSHIILCDLKSVGPLMTDSAGIRSTERFIRSRDLRQSIFYYRAGLAMDNGGEGIALIKNVVAQRGTDFASNIVATFPGDSIGLGSDETFSGQIVSGSA